MVVHVQFTKSPHNCIVLYIHSVGINIYFEFFFIFCCCCYYCCCLKPLLGCFYLILPFVFTQFPPSFETMYKHFRFSYTRNEKQRKKKRQLTRKGELYVRKSKKGELSKCEREKINENKCTVESKDNKSEGEREYCVCQ